MLGRRRWLCGLLVTLACLTAWRAVPGSTDAHAQSADRGAQAPAALQQQGTWTAQSSGVAQTLRAVCFADEENGWAVGGESEGDVVIVHTDNGGRKWQKQSSPVAQRMYAVSFWDARHGWAGGDGGAMLRTIDGGQSWHAQDSGSTSTIVGLAATGPESALAAVRSGHIRRTTDGGANWVRMQGTAGIGLFAISFPDASNGWVSGSQGLIARTSDGGVSWASQNSGSTGRVAAIDFADALNGWAVGNSLMHTSDGYSWHMQSRPDPEQKSLNAVSVVDARTAFAVGDESRAFSTRDGGATWARETLPRRVSLNGVDFPSGCRGWAVGWGGTILHYQSPCVQPPTQVPPTATATPIPPTATPTATPTVTLTPTPSVPWARWRSDGRLLVAENGTGRARVVFGSMGLPVVITGTLTGAATFVGGRDTLQGELFQATGTYDLLLEPRGGAVAGDPFELTVHVGGVPLWRPGVVAHSVLLPDVRRQAR